jgi:UDP-N-acetylmuramoyl-tripeptide--D-alanyl-D-alanine ligase
MAFQGVSTDTRDIRAGDLFVALRGENFDAHDFLEEAARLGASSALVEKPTTYFSHYIQVADSRRGLGLLASGWAEQFPVLRIAVTGNAGKTTVKEMISCMLGEGVLATRGNLNNEIGVPLTLLSLRAEHRFAVVELGASAAGEIAWTTSLLRPQVAMITNVTGAHLEGFGSMQGIANAKAEIFSGMSAGSIAIINRDDSFADFFAESARTKGLKLVSVGVGASNDFSVTKVVSERDRCACVLTHQGASYDLSIPLAGAHQVGNALMALAAVTSVGVPLTDAIQRLQAMRPVKGRMNVQPCLGGTLVDDSYNANPGSVRAAIDWLRQQPGDSALVIGRLGELGDSAESIMYELGEYAARAQIGDVIAMPTAASVAAGFSDNAIVAEDISAAANRAKAVLMNGGTVLVKGSRSARMEAVVEALRVMGGTH